MGKRTDLCPSQENRLNMKNRIQLLYILISSVCALICIPFSNTQEEITNPSVYENINLLEITSDLKLPPKLENELNGPIQNWARLTGFEFSGLHWNNFIIIFVNKNPEIYTYNYAQYIKNFTDEGWDEDLDDNLEPDFSGYEEGTVFLKKHYSAQNGRPAGGHLITIMKKMNSGYDSNFGDWKYYWIDGITGKMIQEGNSKNESLYKSCIECHANIADRDYIFSTFGLAANFSNTVEIP